MTEPRVTQPRIVSIDLTHLVVAALRGDAATASPPLTKPRDPQAPPPPPAFESPDWL